LVGEILVGGGEADDLAMWRDVECDPGERLTRLVAGSGEGHHQPLGWRSLQSRADHISDA
jgi:hypothetical protein